MTAVPVSMTDVRELVDGALRAAVGRLDPRTYRVAAYHLGWADAEGRPRAVPAGKALRPALALLSARAAGAPQESALPGAVAVELVHAFSLLHDDIMDGDRTRRHRPAAWAAFGEPAAILAGDGLLALAGEVLLEAPGQGSARAARALAVATRRLIAGQNLDLEFETRRHITLDECQAMSADKTAALLACSCSIGAVLDGAPEPLCAALEAFGTELGLAFQLVDDLLGIWGDPAVTGKPTMSDLRSRKMSLPVVAALNSGTPASARLAELYGRPFRGPGHIGGTDAGYAAEADGMPGAAGAGGGSGAAGMPGAGRADGTAGAADMGEVTGIAGMPGAGRMAGADREFRAAGPSAPGVPGAGDPAGADGPASAAGAGPAGAGSARGTRNAGSARGAGNTGGAGGTHGEIGAASAFGMAGTAGAGGAAHDGGAAGDGGMAGEDPGEVARLVELAGGRAWAEAEAARRVERAAGHLADVALPGAVRTEFLHIARFVTRRDY